MLNLSGSGRSGSLLRLAAFTALFAAVFSTAFAADFTLDIDGTESNPATLDQAVIDINTAGAGGTGTYQEEVKLTIGADVLQTANTSGTLDPLYLIHGAPSAANPTIIGPNGGFKSVTITGGGGMKTIGYADDPLITTRNRIMEIINVSGTDSKIALSLLKFTGGRLTDPSTTSQTGLGGGGLYIGSASGATTTGKYPGDPDGGFAEKISLGTVYFEDNHVSLAVDNSGVGERREASGGGVLVDGTDYAGNTAGSAVSFGAVNLTGNSVTITSTDVGFGGTDSHAYGGGAHIKNAKEFTYSSSDIKENIAKTVNGSKAAGGGVAVTTDVDHSGTASLSGLAFTENQAILDLTALTSATGHALGGALYASQSDTLGTTFLTLGVTSSTFSENSAKASGNGADAAGGAAYLDGNVKATFTSVSFKENDATSDDGEARGGAIGQGYDPLSILSPTASLTIGKSSFEKNTADGKTLAYGGAIYGEFDMTITETSFSTNTATGEIARGGAIYGTAPVDVTGSAFEGNEAVMKTGGTYAAGGAIYAERTLTSAGTNYLDNKATGNNAFGGAIYSEVAGTATVTGAVMSGNQAVASAAGTAQGGAIFGQSTVSVGTSTLQTNSVSGGDIGQGGAIYSQENVVLADTNLLNNKAEGTTTAQGGAVYMSTDSATGGQLTLSSSVDKTMIIKGNTVKDGGMTDPEANAIHFGGNGTANGVLAVNTDGDIYLYDPIRVEMTTAGSFTLNRTGTETLYWHGENHFTAAGGSTLNLNAGRTMLSKDFTAIGGATGDFTVNLDGTWGFDGSRYYDGVNPSLAMFDYTAVTGTKLFTIDPGTDIDIDMSSELVDGSFSYLVASGYDPAFASQNFSSTHLDSTIWKNASDEIWLDVQYKSIYQGLINAADPNTKSAIAAGTLPEVFRDLTAEERAMMTSSTHYFDSFTPGWFLNQMHVGRSILTTGVDTALRYGVGKGVLYHSDLVEEGGIVYGNRGLPMLAPAGYHNGPRFWAGYMGDFDSLDSHDEYHGYKSDRHGIIAGINYDFGMANSIGLYGGYTYAKTTGKGVAAKVESDVGHVGVIGRFSPFREITRLSVIADAGYTFGDNDTERAAGTLLTTGEFDQKYYTMGLEVEYAARFGDAFITPFASARYIHLKGETFDERGALASHLEDVNESAFTTRLGANFGYDFRNKNGNVITPSFNLAWRHEFGDKQYSSNTYYKNAVTPVTYKVKSTGIDRDSVDIGIGIRTHVDLDDRRLNVNAGYNLNASSNRTNHSLYVGFDLSF